MSNLHELLKAREHFKCGMFIINTLIGSETALQHLDTIEFINQINNGTFKHPEKELTADKLPDEDLKLNNSSLKPYNKADDNKKELDMLSYQGKKIKKRKDNRYQARYYKDNIRCIVYGKTQSECYENLKKAISKKNCSKNINSSSVNGNQKLSIFLLSWLELYRVGKRAPATIKKDRNNISNINKIIGNYKLKDLSTIILQKYFNDIEGDRQREHLFVLIKHALRKAVELKYIKENPMNYVEIKKYESPERLALTVEEVQQFTIRAEQSSYKNYYIILLYEGLRPGELAGLNIDNIKSDSITIKNAMDELGNIKDTKTKAGRRTIPIFPQAAEALQNFKPVNVTLDSIRVDFKKIIEELHFDTSIQLYNLRHTFITRCAEQGVHPKVVQKWAGHKTIEITLKYYTHVNVAWEQKEADKVRADFDSRIDSQNDTRPLD
jgi:integrase